MRARIRTVINDSPIANLFYLTISTPSIFQSSGVNSSSFYKYTIGTFFILVAFLEPNSFINNKKMILINRVIKYKYIFV